MDTPKNLQLDGTVDIEAASGDPKRLPRISIEAYSGGIMKPVGAWGDVVVDLTGVKVPAGGKVPILKDHDHSQIVGHAEVTIDRTIKAIGVISGTGPAAQEVVGAAKNQFPWKASIGIAVEKSRYLDSPKQTAEVNGQSVSGPLLVVERSLLGEVSLLVWPADQSTSATVAAKAGQSTTQGGVRMDDTRTVEELRQQEAAETRRIAAIREICNGQHPTIEAEAIEAGWGVARCELECLRAERQAAPKLATGGSSTGLSDLDATASGLLCAAGLDSVVEQEMGAKAAEVGSLMRHWSMMDFAKSCLQARGAYRSSDSKDEVLRAAFSTSSFPQALSSSLGKTVAASYRNAPSAWRSICDKRSVANFHTATAVRLSSFEDLEQVGPAGEIKDGPGGESYFQFSVATYAKTFSLTRTQLVNDDANLFAGVAAGLGRAAARTLNNKFTEVLLANSGSHFSAGNSNYFSGASTNLQSSSLATAAQMMRQMVDENGHAIDIEPKWLLVPADLEVTGRELLNSTEVLRYETADNKLPIGNAFRDFVSLVVEPRLSMSSFSGYSSTAWYLWSDASNSGMVVAFLQGRQVPVVEQVDLDFRQLGIGWRTYIDAGFALGDTKSAVMSKGAA